MPWSWGRALTERLAGGFVASSGLESYHAHGLLNPGADGLLHFIRLSLETYSNSSAALLLDAHRLIARHVAVDGGGGSAARQRVLYDAGRLDDYYHALTLNHVAQRASKAQGIALLTLFTKSFAQPTGTRSASAVDGAECSEIARQLKARIRAGVCHGHLPICWAVFTACLGIGARRSLQVHLFLQVRAIISSAIRLNIVGPYLAHRLLAFHAKDIIDDNLARMGDCTTGLLNSRALQDHDTNGKDADEESDWRWTWTESDEGVGAEPHMTPRMTWPLGDLVQARHDQLHSRLFNS